jgi:hypothetical protein
MEGKHIKDLMEAYLQMYAPKEEIEEGKSSRPRYPGGRGVLDQERRDEKREASAENMRGHTAGAGTVTKNPKKLRKQKAMGELGEAVKGADPEMRKAASAERRAGDKPLSKKVGDAHAANMARKIRFSDKVTKAKGHIPGYAYAEEVDIFDVVLEFLQVEGIADTLEEAAWVMANLIDEEIVSDILDEASYSAKAARAGKDIGKPGKAFAKIAASAAKRYGSKERGEKVAGAVLAKLRKEEIELLDEVLDTPEKANEYAKKNVKSMLGAFAKGVVNKDMSQMKTIKKRTEGAKMAKRKAERKAAEEN